MTQSKSLEQMEQVFGSKETITDMKAIRAKLERSAVDELIGIVSQREN